MDDILNAWKGADWSALLARIDGEIASMEARASEAETGKKTLLAASGEYRKGTTKEQRAVAVPLIKTFQKEVDECTSRSRQVETVLVDLCQKLAALPDPSPVFEQCSVWQRSAQRANEEADELRDNIQQLTHEFSHLQNQDVTLRLLKEKIKELECEKTSEVAQSATDTELALREEFSIREQEMSLRGDKLRAENASLEKKVSELEQRVRDAHRQLDSARLAADQREALEAEQSDIVQRDLDRANRRIASLESEMDRLAAQLVEAQRQETRPPRTGLEDIAALGGLMKERDAQIQKLTDENRRLSERLAKAAAASESKLSALQQQLNEKTLRVMECEAVLSRQHDYDAIKNELRLLRSMEFGSETSGIDGEMTVGEAVKTIDQLMADKNRRLDRDNAQLRLASEQLQVAAAAAAVSSAAAQETDELNNQLLCESLQPVVEAIGRICNGQGELFAMQDEKDPLFSVKTEPKEEQGETAEGEGPVLNEEHNGKNLFQLLMESMGTEAAAPKEKTPEYVVPSFTPPHPTTPLISHSTPSREPTATELKVIQELQGRVAANIKQLGGKALNTAQIAMQCKRLMVAYNIGQRLFAKYIMNQSQGSLSELLSKPRHWAKLTDKGREAFRRIYGWISDIDAIEMLCSLSPRRIHPDVRNIDHPTPESLLECNSGSTPLPETVSLTPAKPETTDENSFRRAASAKEDQYRLGGTGQSSGSGQKSSRWRHDDIPKEKITQIFQTELAKLKEQESNLERAIASRPTFTNGNASGTSLKKLEQMAFNELSGSAESIQNHAQQVMQTRVRLGLQPVTPADLDAFGAIDTEETVRQIKEFLAMNSISQRQFGEHVLGLSQGSVSDMLTRPKTWHQLTAKGREPFIRMRMFMRDVAEVVEGGKESSHSSVKSASPSVEVVDMKKVKSEMDEKPEPSYDTIDTMVVVRRVKDRLHLHGISQRLFGDVVLSLSAGATSEIFLRPKPWDQLVGRMRDPYVKMAKWIDDKQAIAKLIARERYETGAVVTPDNSHIVMPAPVTTGQKRSNPLTIIEAPPRKVQRTVITEQQKDALRFVFQHEQHPSQKTVEQLSTKLGLNIRTVNNWFHNYRTRQKASIKEGKVHESQIIIHKHSDDWQKDLAIMLDEAAQKLAAEETAPTMVGGPAANATVTVEAEPAVDLLDLKLKLDLDGLRKEVSTSPKPSGASSLLDKAVERLRLMQNSK